LRRSSRALRSRESFYYWQQSLQGSQLIGFHRRARAGPAGPEEYAMVILNFGSFADTIEVPFPKSGMWTEKLDAPFRTAPLTVNVASPGETKPVTVPSNYGYIFIL
jgi:hypothetical protein